MPWIAIILITLFIAALAFQLSIVWRAKQQIGQQAPELSANDDGQRVKLYYFHSPSCGPCKRMTPIVEELAKAHGNVYSVDITQNMELAQNYRVRATPTFIQVREGRVSDVLLGPKSAAKLRSLLD